MQPTRFFFSFLIYQYVKDYQHLSTTNDTELYLDTWDDAQLLDEVNEGAAIIILLVQGLVEEDHSGDVVAKLLQKDVGYRKILLIISKHMGKCARIYG